MDFWKINCKKSSRDTSGAIFRTISHTMSVGLITQKSLKIGGDIPEGTPAGKKLWWIKPPEKEKNIFLEESGTTGKPLQVFTAEYLEKIH